MLYSIFSDIIRLVLAAKNPVCRNGCDKDPKDRLKEAIIKYYKLADFD